MSTLNSQGRRALVELMSQLQAAPDSHKKENKTIRIRPEYANRIRDLANDRARDLGHRVAESDIIDDALSLYFAVIELGHLNEDSSSRSDQ